MVIDEIRVFTRRSYQKNKGREIDSSAFRLIIVIGVLELRRHSLSQFDKKARIGPIEWPHYDLFHVHRGAIQIEFPALNARVQLPTNTGVLIWPDTLFQGFATTPTAWGSIQHFAVRPGVAPPFDALVRRARGFTRSSSPSRELTRDVERALALARQPVSDELTVMRPALLALILGEGGFLARPKGNQPDSRFDLTKLRTWLHENLDRGPGVADLARVVGLSASRFRVVFRTDTGHSVGEFLKSVREAEARQMLIDTPYTLKAIADKLGYADAVAFSHAFKSRVRVTPGEFRRRHSARG